MAAKVFIFIGLIILGGGLAWGYLTFDFINNSVKTEARVKQVIKKHRSITPVFEFTVKGKTYEFEGTNTRPDAYELNDKETIYYNPADPDDNRTGNFMNLWFVPVFLTGFGTIFAAAGLGTFLFKGKKKSPFTVNRQM
jgi:uncharacterized membrane protein